MALRGQRGERRWPVHTLTTAPAPRPDRQAGTGTPEREGRLPEAAPGHSVRPWPVVRATDAIWPPVSLLEGVPDVTPHSRLWLPGSSPGSSPASPGAGLQVCSIVTPLPELPPYPQLPGAWVPWQGYGQGGCPSTKPHRWGPYCFSITAVKSESVKLLVHGSRCYLGILIFSFFFLNSF